MALQKVSFGKYTVTCDDPYHRGCSEQLGPYFGQGHAQRLAEDAGWYLSKDTGKDACPTCMQLHQMTLDKKVENRSMTRDEADNSGDPFTAAFIAMALGGDPLTAGLTTMFTGSTSLGVIAGIIAGDHDKSSHQVDQYQVGDGGASGGAGAGASFDAQFNQPATDQSAPDNIQSLPVIADPFSSQTVPPNTDSPITVESTEFSPPTTVDTPTEEKSDDDGGGSNTQGTSY